MAKIKSFIEVEANDLIDGRATEFETNRDFEVPDEGAFLDEEFDDFQNSLLNKFVDDSSYADEPNDVPFDKLKEKMTPITPDDGVMKEVIKCGEGGVVSNNSIFIIHYSLHLEKADLPFDSTWLQKKPLKIWPGGGGAVPGVALSVSTMKKGEVSRFLIGHKYAFGELGAAPRIPPKATLLCRIHVLNVYLSSEAMEFEDMTMAQRRAIPFEKLVKIYHTENQLANDYYDNKEYKKAILRYKRIMSILEDVSVTNEPDDTKRKGYLFKLYLNIAISNIKLGYHHAAIIYSDLALKLQPHNPKALYRMGLARLKSPQYESSEHYFLKVLKCGGREAAEAEKRLNELRLLQKRDRDVERQYCKRMFGNADKPNATAKKESVILDDLSPEMRAFADGFMEELQEFQFSKDRELSLSAGLMEEELDIVRRLLAGREKLAFVEKTMNGEKINKIAKNEAFEW